jgi:predicted ATPase
MRSHHGTISLAPLDRHQVRQMVGELAARHALPNEVVDGVTERTGGVPLFVEEVTRLLLERGERGGIQAIPPTLQQSLTARLDRLGPARDVAQIGAVIGRDFSYGLLRAVANMEDASLQMALERLAEADILLVQGLPRTPIIASSTRSFRMRLMRICSKAGARYCTGALEKSCATSSPAPLRRSRSCLHIISLRRA